MALPGSPASGSQGRVKLDMSELGPTDMALTGQGWTVPVHRCLPASPVCSCQGEPECRLG